MIGDVSRAQALTSDLSRRYPEDTIVQFKELPTLRAQLALSRNRPFQAIEELQAATPYDEGLLAIGSVSYSAYVRGEAYLAAHDGSKAAGEFQKITAHRIIGMHFVGALARLGLARSERQQGNTVKAKSAYQAFLTLWKDADADLPILKQARAEYATIK